VVYNWGYNSCYGGEKNQVGNAKFNFTNINMVANYYKPGPATRPGEVSHRIANPSTRDGAADSGKWYIADNVVEGVMPRLQPITGMVVYTPPNPYSN